MTDNVAAPQRATRRRAKHSAQAATTKPSIHVVRSTLGGVTVGIEAMVVDRIEDADSPDRDDVTLALDLATLLEIEAPPEGSLRRSLLIRSKKGVVRLKVGILAKIVSLSAEDVYELPTFLEGLSTAAGFRSIFLEEDGIGFLVDVGSLDTIKKR